MAETSLLEKSPAACIRVGTSPPVLWAGCGSGLRVRGPPEEEADT